MKKKPLRLEITGNAAPYFNDISSWEKAKKANNRSMRKRKAAELNPKGTLPKLTQVTPGEWKTK